jgi:hypothetical protein
MNNECACGFYDISTEHRCADYSLDNRSLPMTKHEKVANIMAFLTILFGEDSNAWEKIMDFSPEYIIEKFEGYILSTRIEYPWGMHPTLRNGMFYKYVDKWKLELKHE